VTDRSKYLQRYPTGRIDFRFQRKALATLPLPEGSKAFNDEYDRLLASVSAKAKPKGRPAAMVKPKAKSGTVGLFVERWRASDFFADPGKPGLTEVPFAKNTKDAYRRGLAKMHKRGVTELTFADLTPKYARQYIAKVKRENGGSAARRQKTLLSILWDFSKDFPDFDGGDRLNPMTDIKSPYAVKREHEPWPQEVQDDFLTDCDENLYDAFHLLICTGQRVGDIARMKKSQYDGTYITLTQQKTDNPMRIRAPKMLQDVLARRNERLRGRHGSIGHNSVAASCERAAKSAYLLTNAWGKPYTASSLSQMITKVIVCMGERGMSKGKKYSAHGLRKNAGILLAENGATVPQIMAALGHKTPKMALYYCRLANQKLLADQAADILDIAFAGREAGRQAKVAKRRASLKLVD
jgi:integrase